MIFFIFLMLPFYVYVCDFVYYVVCKLRKLNVSVVVLIAYFVQQSHIYTCHSGYAVSVGCQEWRTDWSARGSCTNKLSCASAGHRPWCTITILGFGDYCS